jgi:putative effector of murein hydrolase
MTIVPGFLASLLTCFGVALAFALMRRLSARLGHPAWANPVLAAALLVIALLTLLGVPISAFQRLAAPLGWALGPAIVALAAVADLARPLLFGRGLSRSARAALLAVTGGMGFGLGVAWAMARWLGLRPMLVTAATTKSVSSPFVIAILGDLGAPAPLIALAAALSVTSGVIAAMLVPPLFDRLKLHDRDSRALALGVSGHLVASEYAVRHDPGRGGLAVIALVAVGLLASLLVPLLWPLLAP